MSEHALTTKEVRDVYMFATQEVDMEGYVIVSAQEAYARFDRWLARVKAEALREAVAAMRRHHEGHWNLRGPRDPEVAYSVDVWLEVRADRIESQETP